MSIDVHIFLADSGVPDREAWQKAIEQLGFPTVLDSAFDVRSDTGFRPAKYDAQSTGFEFHLGAAADVLPTYPHVAARIGARDKCATFTWGGDLTEMCVALSAAAAFAKLADGIWYSPEDDIIYTADEAVEATRRDLSSV
jgi:hypothetical protein